MNKMYGLTNLRVKRFDQLINTVGYVNAFLKKYDGDIVDIQSGDKYLTVIYVEKDEE